MPERRLALSLVERGWHGARQCSLALGDFDVEVVHLIRGTLRPAELRLIQPYPWIRLRPVSRTLFWLAAWAWLARMSLTRRLGWVLVDNPRTAVAMAEWCRRLGVRCVEVRQEPQRYTLAVDGQSRPLAEVFT